MRMRVFALCTAVVILAALALSGCKSGGSSDDNSPTNAGKDNDLPEIGYALKYNPQVPVNDGKPITLTFWVQEGLENYIVPATKEYSKMHPNVKWKLTSAGWDDHFKKLPIALQSGTGPDIFSMHNAFTNVLVPNMEPLPESIFPLDQLKADFKGIDAHVMDGKLYYFDTGIMTSAIFYNKKMWSEAGLTEADIPTTWDQFRVIAKKLTKTDDSGKIIRNGFNINGGYLFQAVWKALTLQQGTTIFTKDGKTRVDSTAAIKSIQFISDLYNVDKVASVNFPGGEDAFGKEQSSMVYSFGYLGSQLKNTYPNVDYGVFKLPTWDGNVPPAYDNNNGESTFGISAKSNAAHKAVALDFLKYYLAEDKYLLSLNVDMFLSPSKLALDHNPQITGNKIIAIESQVLDRTVWLGPYPDIYDVDGGRHVGDAILINKMAVETAIAKAVPILNKDLADSNFVPTEDKYQYASEMTQ